MTPKKEPKKNIISKPLNDFSPENTKVEVKV